MKDNTLVSIPTDLAIAPPSLNLKNLVRCHCQVLVALEYVPIVNMDCPASFHAQDAEEKAAAAARKCLSKMKQLPVLEFLIPFLSYCEMSF